MTKNSKQESKKPIDFKYNLTRYWEFVRNYKIFFFSILSITLVFQIFYVVERYLFKIITDGAADFAANSISRVHFLDILILAATIFIFILVLQVIFRWVWVNLINKFDSSIMLDLKKAMFDHVIQLDHEFHVNTKTGSMISKLIRGAGSMERLSDVIFFNFAPLMFQVIVVAGSIMFFDLISAIVVIVTTFVFIWYSFFINKKQQKANLEANDAEDEEKAVISDYLTNVESVKYFGKEEKVKKSYYKYGRKTKTKMLTHWNYFRDLSAGHTLIIGLGIFFILLFPFLKILQGEMTVGTVIFIYTSFGVMIGHLHGFDHGIRQFYRAMADFESLFKYYKAKKTIIDDKKAKKLKITKGEIDFKNIWFKYKTKYVLRDFNLKIKPNTRVALVGPSGSGKTTLIKLLYRLYDANKGAILIDGKDISKVKQESLRSELSIVPQEGILFDDTLYNNIAFSKTSATKKEVINAIKFAQLDKVVKNFPKGYNTIVGERGIKLSGGEKQRVSIARAILANKKILVLDEATSALDSKTEFEIQKDFNKLMKYRTSIVIAHRLSTIMKSDLIVVMNKGKIEQIGNHNELIKKKGLYKKLWGLQKGGYI